MVERFREKLTTEQLSTRLDRILRDMEKDAGWLSRRRPRVPTGNRALRRRMDPGHFLQCSRGAAAPS